MMCFHFFSVDQFIEIVNVLRLDAEVGLEDNPVPLVCTDVEHGVNPPFGRVFKDFTALTFTPLANYSSKVW